VQSSENKKDIQFNLFLSNDTLFGEGIYKSTGYVAQNNIALIQNAGNKKREIYEYLFAIGNNKFKLETVNQLFMSRDSGFATYYSFSIPNYLTSTKGEVYINLNLEKELANEKWEDKMNIPLEFQFLRENIYTTSIDIPEPYKIVHIPENLEIDNEIFSVGFIYELKNNKVHFKKYLISKKLIVPLELFDLYNKTVERVCKMYKQCIVLEKGL
jgi:hypothetical protein